MMAGKGFVRVANKNDPKEGGLLKIVMFDSNENEQNILYKDKFDEWSAKNKNLKIIYTITDDNVNSVGWKGEKGRIDKAMITRHLTKSDLDNSIFYVCGPPGMLKATQDLLRNELHVPDDKGGRIYRILESERRRRTHEDRILGCPRTIFNAPVA